MTPKERPILFSGPMIRAILDGRKTQTGVCDARSSYMTLWDSLNAKRGFGWDKNPWVWVIEFKPVHSTNGRMAERQEG